MLLGSRIKVGRTTRLRSAPGRSCEIICERTAALVSYGTRFKMPSSGRVSMAGEGSKLTIALVGLHDGGVIVSIDLALVGRGSIAFIGRIPPVRQHDWNRCLVL